MRTLRLSIALVGAMGLLVLVPIVHRSPWATYGGSDPRLLALEAGAALALLGVALTGPPGVRSCLIAATGCLWLVPELAGAAGVALSLRTVADAIGPLVAVVLLSALALGVGRLDGRVRRALALAWCGAAVAGLARVLLVDPFARRDCWRSCEHNPLLVVDVGDGAPVQAIGLACVAGGVLWTVALRLQPSARRDSTSSSAAAHGAGWVLVLALTLSLFVPPRAATVATEDDGAVVVFVVVQVAAASWLGALAREAWLRWRLESRLARLSGLLATDREPDLLVRTLRGAARDAHLRLAFWAPARQAFVDAQGRVAVDAAPGPGERATTIARRGQTLAIVVHSTRVDGARLQRALGPALRLAVENEQLRAAALAELDELERSRARVVGRATLERRRLERNLHDDAQQRAVSLALRVRMLEGSPEHPSAVEAHVARRATVLTGALIEELRRVARGIYPAVLADSGLAGAVLDLAERSTDLPVAVHQLPEGRCPDQVETSAYLVVRAAIEDARAAGASSVAVTGCHGPDGLRITMEDDAPTTACEAVTERADLVRAVGGTLVVDGSPGRRRVEVVLPCGS